MAEPPDMKAQGPTWVLAWRCGQCGTPNHTAPRERVTKCCRCGANVVVELEGAELDPWEADA